MIKQKFKPKLTILEAVDNLSSLAELDAPPEEGEEVSIDWTDNKQLSQNQERIKETFRVLNHYLHHIYQKERGQLKDISTQRGIQAMMVLAGEAAQKMDKYTSLFKGAHGGGIAHLKEFQDLQKFYLHKIVNRFQEFLESEAAWEAEWSEPTEVMDLERRTLKDLETIRRDREYELFYIKKEDGSPFFNRSLIRHIRLIGEFDDGITDSEIGEHPLTHFKIIQDKELQISAKEILHLAAAQIEDFYKGWTHQRERPYVLSLHKALMALMLASNSRNLIQNSIGKSCQSYYQNFHFFLREALRSDEYRKYTNQPQNTLQGFNRILVNLSQVLASLFFTRIGSRSESIAYIQRLIAHEHPPLSEKNPEESVAFWNSLLDADDQLRSLLKNHPNGPLLKALEAFKNREIEQGFDPLSQYNYPSQLFTLSDNSIHVTLLRLPSPTFQEYIKVCKEVEEFTAFLRYLYGKQQKHLLINLQNRTSLEEHARSVCLERVAIDNKEALSLCTLPKDTDFYLQKAPYQNQDEAKEFIQNFKKQIESVEECGYYFPPDFRTKELKSFVDGMMSQIHHFFFMDNPQLTLKNRLDFIEIFYHFLTLKFIEWINPDTMSFTCKDAIDTGAAASASFFAFIRMLSDRPFSSDEKNQLLWILFNPTLSIRARAIDIQPFNRSISCLAHMDTLLDSNRELILSALNEYYTKSLLTSLKLSFP